MKKEHKIFFAIPFDTLTKNTYDRVSETLRSYFKKKGHILVTIIGNEQIGSSPAFSNLMSFRAQNTDLQRQFLKEISGADVIIADLTNNNPNVHVELGVALTLNKNILRVTGRSIEELGFDIQNLQAHAYKTEDQLFDQIVRYLEVFFTIKKLSFSEKYKPLYKKVSTTIMLPDKNEQVTPGALWTFPIKEYSFRDGAIRFESEFIDSLNSDAWLGVYFRADEHFLFSSYLLYLRKNGTVELAEYNSYSKTNFTVIYKKQFFPAGMSGKINVSLGIENDQFEVTINRKGLRANQLQQQNKGKFIFATYEARASFDKIELIDRDTIDPLKTEK